MDWITFIKESENEAIARVYREYRDLGTNWIQKNFPLDFQDALDIFQISVVALYDNVITGRLTELNVDIGTYLLSIVKNKSLERMRDDYKQQRSKSEYWTAFDSETVQDSTSNEFNFVLIEQLVKAMGDPCKMLLELYYYHNLSLEMIREKMNYASNDTVKTKKYKCMKRLQTSYFERISS